MLIAVSLQLKLLLLKSEANSEQLHSPSRDESICVFRMEGRSVGMKALKGALRKI